MSPNDNVLYNDWKKKRGVPRVPQDDDPITPYLGMWNMLPKRLSYRISTSIPEKLAEILFTKGIEEFLTLDTQKQAEDPPNFEIANLEELQEPSWNPDHIDFNGSYGCYYKELFFHIPFLIANHLNANQKFEESKWWYERIFNPASSESLDNKNPNDRNWQYILFRNLTLPTMKEILTDTEAIKQYEKDPFNPHAIARLRITAYQKAIVMNYIQNLIDLGDQLFELDSTESINQATMLYILASDILGKRPAELGKCKTVNEENLTYKKISPLITTNSEFLLTLENWSVANEIEKNLLDPLKSSKEKQKLSLGLSFLQNTLIFCIPTNKDLLDYWNLVEDRLYKIRNCMNISGIKRELSLFSPEINPMLLVKAKAAGLSLDDVLMGYAVLPPYRFSYLIEKAKQYAQSVQSFGSALLSALQTKDNEDLFQLRSVHEQNILKMTEDIKKQQVNETDKNYQSLVESQTNIQNKIDYYTDLLKTPKNSWEITQQVTKRIAGIYQLTDTSLYALTAIAYLSPQAGSPVSLNYGGKQMGDSGTLAAAMISSSIKTLEMASSSAGLEATFQRRKEEWDLQLKLANQEKLQIDQHVLASEIRKDIAKKDLEIHQQNIKQADELYQFYKEKFTSLGLYDYLCTKLNRLFREAYNLAYDMAKMAEKAYQFERDDENTTFIANDNWPYDRAGLLSGESLQQQLQQMEKSYIETNNRDYEITQSFSLSMLNPEELINLRQTGSCDFKIPEIAYDLTYPGQYKRLIKSVSITIPSVVGPHTNIGAKLTLIGSDIRKEAKIGGTLLPSDVQKNDSIYASSAQNDTGMFEFNFRDERYHPFEGAGAISNWNLSLPSVIHSFDYDTISDVIIHVSYTAKDDGVFRDDVEKEIEKSLSNYAADPGLYRLISLEREFPNSLHQLLTSDNSMTEFELEKNHFPYFLSKKDLSLSHVTVFIQPKDGSNLIALDEQDIEIKNNEGLIGVWSIEDKNNKINSDNVDDVLLLLRYNIS